MSPGDAAMVLPASRPRWLVAATWLLIGLGMAAMAVVLYRNDVDAAGNSFLGCVFYKLTGHYCIGCGMTRACRALLQGDVLHAFAMNPLGVTLMPMAALSLAWWSGWRTRFAEPVIRLLSRPMFWVAVLPAYWLLRNLPWPPFSWLAPGGLGW